MQLETNRLRVKLAEVEAICRGFNALVLIIIDGSSSIQSSDFQIMTNLVKWITGRFIYPDSLNPTKIAALQFASRVADITDFTSNRESLYKSIGGKRDDCTYSPFRTKATWHWN